MASRRSPGVRGARQYGFHITGEVIHMPPVGYYLASDAGRLAGVSGYEIGQWARYGYIRSSQSEPGASPRVYSFQDVAEAMVVHQLLDRGIRHREIKTILESLRADESVTDWPLSSAVLEGPAREGVGQTIAVKRGGSHFDLKDRPWSGVLNVGDLRTIASDLNRGGWAARELGDLKYIEVHPDVLSGRPAIRGHRIAARSAGELALVPGGDAILRDEYDLNDDEIRDGRRWWEAARRYEAA